MQDKCHQRYQFHGVDLFARKQAFTRPIRIEDITGPWIDVTPLGGNGNGWLELVELMKWHGHPEEKNRATITIYR